jgi:simple sugar transport system ATP-binding protein
VKLLILDEPTATLAPADAAALLAWARRFASGGHAVVLITHKLRDALDVADEVTVLRAGRVVLSAGAASVTERSLAVAMLGDGESASGEQSIAARGVSPARAGRDDGRDVVAELRGVTVSARRGTPGLASVAFAARRGEIVGIAAVEGNGERELLRILAGRERPDAGAVRLPPTIAYIPQDRHSDAIADDLSLTENIALAGAGARRGWIDWRSMRARTAELMTRFDVRASSDSAAARTLSGGNQQRLVLARELDGEPSLVVADQPTRGLDLRATADVHERLRQARAAGAAVVLHSADLDEILALADRVVVDAQGRLQDVGMNREVVGRAMLGAGA